MAVYERRYKRYEGSMTAQRGRFWVIPRYAIQDVFRSKLFVAFFVLALLPPAFVGLVVYILHIPTVATVLQDLQIGSVDESWYQILMRVQTALAFVTALFIGPGLISKDLANNSLPLYLSRPFSRAEYILGKLTLLAFLLSCITWAPVLGLFVLQGNFEGIGWMMDHHSLALGIFISSWLWILSVSLLALALSAWVKWRPVAAFMMLLIIMVGYASGAIINSLFKIQWGGVVSMVSAIGAVFRGLFGIPTDGGLSAPLGGLALLGVIALSILLLHLKLRAYEVVS